MLDFGSVRRRLIALTVITLIVLAAWYAGKVSAQPVEREGPEFMLRWADTEGAGVAILKVYHIKTGSCWIARGSTSTLLPVSPEVCK